MSGLPKGRTGPGMPSRALIGQIVRYVLVGGFVTALQSLTYWLLAHFAGWHPQLANLTGYLVAVASGYALHGRVTFKAQGGTAPGISQAVRFVLVSWVGLALNAFWVQLCTAWLGWPVWSPIPLMAMLTPGLVFVLNRRWVFR